MKIFIAAEGSYKPNKYLNYKLNVLESYYYLTKKQKENILDYIKEFDSFFLDSGAFTAFTQGTEIDIDEYVNFCMKSGIKNYAVLDKIGSAKGTLKNQKYMESKGATPIPCFHYGEDWKYLDFYCEKYDYIALGGMVPISTPKLERWLDAIFSKYPNQKFHGFGLTVLKLMDKYPWYSVDSTSWKVGGITGSIYTPFGCFCISENGFKKNGYYKTNHIKKKSIDIQNKVKQYAKSKNYDWNDLTADDGALKRVLLNVEFFYDIQEKHNTVDFTIKQSQLETFFSQSEPNIPEDNEREILFNLRKEFPNLKESSIQALYKQRYE